jgi:hypothetical protein
MSEQQLGADDPDEDLTLLLLQRVWQGKLPTKISLAANESKSFTNTPPFYVSPQLPGFIEFRSNSPESFTYLVFSKLLSVSSKVN